MELLINKKILDIVSTEPKQFQLTLLSIILLIESRSIDKIFTGDIYNAYQDICRKTKNEILTQRRISDIIAEFDMLGIVNAQVISKGRYGRTREIRLNISQQIIPKVKDILNNSLNLT